MLPHDHPVEARLGLAVCTGLAQVHLDAEGAAVDLRGPQHDQVVQQAVEAMAADRLLRRAERLQHVGNGLLVVDRQSVAQRWRSEEHTSELQSLMRISYAV